MPEVLGRLRPPRLTSPPASPAGGEEYYDTGLNQLLYWNGTTWVAGGSGGSGGTTIVNAAPVPQNTAARAYRAAALGTTAGAWNKVGLDTTTFDPGGNISLANGRYICPVAGLYQVEGQFSAVAVAGNLMVPGVYKNGALTSSGSANYVAAGDSVDSRANVTDIVQCNAGDYLELYVYTSMAVSLESGAGLNYLSVSRTDVAGAWGANPLNTAARAYRNAALTAVVSTYSKVPVDTVSYDAGGNLQLANGRYVCPTAGFYHVSAQVNFLATAAGQEAVATVYKNGALVTQGTTAFSAAGSQAIDAQVTDTVQCNAGDYLELWYYANAAIAMTVSPWNNFLSASRVDMVGSGGPGFSMNTAARAYRNAAFTTVVGYSKVPLDTTSFDTGNNLQLVNGRYVCPVAGYYQINGSVAVNAGTGQYLFASVWKNGVNYAVGTRYITPTVAGIYNVTINEIVQCNAGDYLELYVYDQVGGHALDLSQQENYLSVVKVDVGGTPGSGWKQYAGAGTPSIAAVPGNAGDFCVRTSDGEVFEMISGAWVDQGWSLQGAQLNATYSARAYRAAAFSLPASAWSKVPLDTKAFDPGNNVSLASGRYVCPVAGYYAVEGNVNVTAAAPLEAAVYKNGVLASGGTYLQTNVGSVVVDSIQCNAGDYLELWAINNSASALPLGGTGSYNYLAVSLVAATSAQQQPLQAASQARAYRTAALSVAGAGTFSKIPLDTASYDAGNNFQVANGRYVCPVGGYYQVNGEVATSTSIAGFAAIYKNGVLASEGVFSTGYSTAVSDVIQCNPGDYLELWYLNSSAGSASVSVGLTGQTYLSVSLVGTQPTAAPANAARAHRAAALTPAASTWTKIPLDTIDTDPGGNVSLANGRYVCPVAGIYDVEASVLFGVSATGTYTNVGCAVYKNGAVAAGANPQPAVVNYVQAQASDKIACNAGDYLELWGLNQQGTALYTGGGAGAYTYLSVSLLTAAPAPLPVTVPQVVTAGLPSSPVDGQECYFVADAANGVVWHLKYRAADPSVHKWQFVGGPELLSGPAGSVVCTSTTYVPLTSGPSITLPIAGDYQIEFGSRWASGGSSSSAQALASLAVGGANVGTAAIASYFFTAAGQQAGGQLALAEALAGQAAGAVVTLNVGGGTSSPSVTLSNGWIKVRPVRLG